MGSATPRGTGSTAIRLGLIAVFAVLVALCTAAAAQAETVPGNIYTAVPHLTADNSQYILHSPTAVAVAPDGDVYVADDGANTVDRFPAGSLPCPSATAAAECYQVVVGDAAPGQDAAAGFSGDGGPATSAELNEPTGLALDSHGNLYIVDSGNYRVRMVPAASGTYFGINMTAGDIYTIGGDGEDGYSGDGGPATSAALGDSVAVAVGPDGSVYYGSGNCCVRKIAPDDTISTFARGVAVPAGLAFGSDGTLYVAGLQLNKVYAVSPAGDVSVVAGTGQAGYSGDGGPATAAQLDQPRAVTVAPDGDLLISDRENCVIRDVSLTTGIITTYAGNHEANYEPTLDLGNPGCAYNGDSPAATGDGGPATSARLVEVDSLWADPSTGDLYLLDQTGGMREVVGDTSGLGSAPAAGITPAIAGTPQIGHALTVTGDWEGVSYPTLSYQWCISDAQSGGSGHCPAGYDPIAGATAQTYTVPEGFTDLGHTLLVSVVAANPLGSVETVSSPSAAVFAPPPQVRLGFAPSRRTRMSWAIVSYMSSGLVTATRCRLDGAPMGCGTDWAFIRGLASGPHVFTVTVKGPGGAARTSVRWRVAGR